LIENEKGERRNKKRKRRRTKRNFQRGSNAKERERCPNIKNCWEPTSPHFIGKQWLKQEREKRKRTETKTEPGTGPFNRKCNHPANGKPRVTYKRSKTEKGRGAEGTQNNRETMQRVSPRAAGTRLTAISLGWPPGNR